MNRKVITVLGLTTLIITSMSNILSLTKTSTISYQVYKEGNTDNLVLNKILSDNELKQEIPKMFNYASNGMQRGADDANPEYITNGLYSNSDEDGTTYYYRGDIDNNNLVFGAYGEDYYVYTADRAIFYQSEESCMEAEEDEKNCQPVKLASKGDKMYWKIVRVNGDGSLRLIYNGPGLNDEDIELSSFDEEEILGVIGNVKYNIESNDPKYSGYTYDNGTDSFIKKEVDTWYNNTLGSNSSYDSKVILGRYCSDSSKFFEQEVYIAFSSLDRLMQEEFDFSKDNAPTFICPTTSESYGGSYRLKAGLITADELVFAGESVYVRGNSYLNAGRNNIPYWSMTPVAFITDVGANVWNEFEFLIYNYVGDNYAVRPVINLTTENCQLTGDGTVDNPYMLEEVNINSYKGKVTIEVGSNVDDNTAFEEELDLSNVTWTSKDESIAKIENGKIIGLKEGTVIITGVGSDGTTYEIEVTVISNPVTSSAVYIGIGLIIILVLGTGAYITYRIKNVINN